MVLLYKLKRSCYYKVDYLIRAKNLKLRWDFRLFHHLKLKFRYYNYVLNQNPNYHWL